MIHSDKTYFFQLSIAIVVFTCQLDASFGRAGIDWRRVCACVHWPPQELSQHYFMTCCICAWIVIVTDRNCLAPPCVSSLNIWPWPEEIAASYSAYSRVEQLQVISRQCVNVFLVGHSFSPCPLRSDLVHHQAGHRSRFSANPATGLHLFCSLHLALLLILFFFP